MKKKIFTVILGIGWVLFALFLISGYFYNKLADTSHHFSLSPIKWEGHMDVFKGAVQCNLIAEDLMKRKAVLKEEIFSHVVKREERSNGLVFYFKNENNLLESVMEHVLIETKCCPFFKFDLSIIPLNDEFALQISGSEAAMELVREYDL